MAAIALNEDNSHFFCWHPRGEMTVSDNSGLHPK